MSESTITVRVPAPLKAQVTKAASRRGYTLTGYVVRALEDALQTEIGNARRLVGRGEITLYGEDGGQK